MSDIQVFASRKTGEALQAQWDGMQKRIEQQRKQIDELKAALEWILRDKKMRQPKSNRDIAIIEACEDALTHE